MPTSRVQQIDTDYQSLMIEYPTPFGPIYRCVHKPADWADQLPRLELIRVENPLYNSYDAQSFQDEELAPYDVFPSDWIPSDMFPFYGTFHQECYPMYDDLSACMYKVTVVKQ